MPETFDTTLTDDAVLEVVLSRPDILNRVDALLHREITEFFSELQTRTDVRAVSLVSTGRAFTAGGDFSMMHDCNADFDARRALMDEATRLIAAMINAPMPIVCGVQGPAMGLGSNLALACDAIVACRSAYLADTHVKIGLVAGDGGCLLWPASAGMLRARRHLLTGDPLSAEEAFQLGMVTDLVDEPDEVRPAAMALATKIAGLPPLAVQSTKRALNRVTQQRFGEVFELAAAYEETSFASDDLMEAIAAFKEKRPGRYQGR